MSEEQNESSVQIPEEIQKQIMAIRRVTECHNVITHAKHDYSNFNATASSIQFLQGLHMDLANEIVKCEAAESIEELKPLFDRKRKSEEFSKAAEVAEQVTKEA